MKRLAWFLIPLTILVFAQQEIYAQKKLAQTGFQFLSVGTDARATAMGEAFTTVEGSSAGLFYNPAGLARMTTVFDLSINQLKWIADIQYYSGSFALNIKNGAYGVLGLSFMTIDYGEFYWTRVSDTEAGFDDYLDWSDTPTALMFGVGYAKELSNKFSVGGQVKYAYQYLGKSFVPIYSEEDTVLEKRSYDLSVPAFDFGTLYKTGFRSLTFGMSVRNFSKEVKYEKEGFQLPLTFKIGISMDAFDFLPTLQEKNQSLVISLDAVHPRSYPEFISLGAEYSFMNILFLRAGYTSNHPEYDFTSGFGVRLTGIEVNFSNTRYVVFDNVRRFSVRFAF